MLKQKPAKIALEWTGRIPLLASTTLFANFPLVEGGTKIKKLEQIARASSPDNQ